MKKVLAIILAVCMMAVFVPAFAVSAAEEETSVPTVEEAIAGKQKLTPFSEAKRTVAEYATVQQGAQIGGCGCGFIDGNVYFDRVEFLTLASALSNEDILVYVDGKPAGLATTLHAGARPNWADRSCGGGFQIGIINAELKSGVESTVTLVFGGTGYYTEFKFTPNASSLSYDSSEIVIRGSRATITVTGASIAAAYKVGDSVKVRLHDDHTDRTFTVASVTGNTVVMTCDNFTSTTKTLVEVEYGTDRAFTANVDVNLPGGELASPTEEGETFTVAYQTKPGALAGNDMRFIFAVKESDLTADNYSIMENGKVTLSFYKGDAVVKTYSEKFVNLSLFKEVVAGNEYWTPAEGDLLTGFIIKDVPYFAWTSFTLSITNGEESLYSGTLEKDIKEQVAMGGFVWLDGEQNITAVTGKTDSVANLFDKNAGNKYEGGRDREDFTITWNYAEAKTISLYALTAAKDTIGYPGQRNPKSWVFYGSNDEGTEKNWTVIDEQKDPQMVREGGQSSFYEVAEPTEYKYYKIDFICEGDWFQIGEMRLFETAAETTYNFNDIITGINNYSSTPEATNQGEGLPELFDNNSSTKFGYYPNTKDANEVTIWWSYASAQTATGYSITTGNDSTRFDRNPSGWTLYGSVDGESEWVKLDTVSYGGNFSGELMIYGIDNPASYQYYKIVFNLANRQFQMSDIALYN